MHMRLAMGLLCHHHGIRVSWMDGWTVLGRGADVLCSRLAGTPEAGQVQRSRVCNAGHRHPQRRQAQAAGERRRQSEG